jgi:hypothetical protein
MSNINLRGVSVSALNETVNLLKLPQCQMAENSPSQLKLMQNLNCNISYCPGNQPMHVIKIKGKSFGSLW